MSQLSTSQLSPSATMFVAAAAAHDDAGNLPQRAATDPHERARELRTRLRREARRSSFAEVFWLCVTVTGVASAVVGVIFR